MLGLLPKGWLRGVDLNHRPLGYEPHENQLTDSFCGTGGTLGTFQEGSVNANGGLAQGVKEAALYPLDNTPLTLILQ